MSITHTGIRIPAGWYPDPLGQPQRRWWDGTTWTPYVHPPLSATELLALPVPEVLDPPARPAWDISA